jgi:hypothetical protein
VKKALVPVSAFVVSAFVVSAFAVVGCHPSGGPDVATEKAQQGLGVAPPTPTVNPVQPASSCTLSVGVQWDAPAGVASSAIQGYTLFRDGYPITPLPWISRMFSDQIQLLPGATYSYQAAWRDQTGALSALSSPLLVTMPPVCTRPEYADGKVTLGAALIKLADARPQPFTVDQARAWLYQDPRSIAAYMTEVSRGALTLQGDVYDWIVYPHNIADVCSIIASDGDGYACSLEDLPDFARQHGIPVDNYERFVFFIDGVDTAGITTGTSCQLQGTHGAISTGTIAHECLGHGFGLSHAGSWDCVSDALGNRTPGVGADPTHPNDANCAVSRYSDRFDPMGVSVHDRSTQNLYLLGLLADNERVTAQAGGVYWLGKLGSGVHPTKELMVPITGKFFYFAEYRAAEGFNALDNCSDCAPSLEGTFMSESGVSVRLWRNSRNQGDTNYDQDDVTTLLVTDGDLHAGQKFQDPGRGINIKVLAEDGDGAQVQVFLCGNGIKDADETDVDCGGSCGPCGEGQTCATGADCVSAACVSGVCHASCTDHIKNGDEVDVDCGGSCSPCADGLMCTVAAGCQGQRCIEGICYSQAECANGEQDGDETAVDCGGTCPACANGASCHAASDCISQACWFGRCMSTCSSHAKDGTETDVDCGGVCPACAVGLVCRTASDCATGVCAGNLCRPATCGNGELDDDEVGVDCGGPCNGCPDGAMWCHMASDCLSHSCLLGRCMSLCNDHVQNGAETDVDCGGTSCPKCASGRHCQSSSDCASGVCNAGTCT